jgi:RNA polymerase sigma factor (TIGR02999 family)
MEQSQHEITQLLQQVSNGDRGAIDRLLPLVYEQLRKMAHQQRLRWQGEATLNTTALVHEAYMRLSEGADLDLESRLHFLRVAAKAMRYILLDHAKAKKRLKRGGDQQRVPFEEALAVSEAEAEELLALDEALSRLEAINERQSQIIECRFFGGMTIEDTAHALNISAPTVKRGWAMARAWLYREMQQSPS